MEDFPSEFVRTEPGGVINVRLLTLPVQAHYEDADFGSSLTLKHVLVRGGVEDVAVYQGVGTDDWVTRNGRKLTYKEALVHFPSLPARWYRH
jgi:hypothetical protein